MTHLANGLLIIFCPKDRGASHKSICTRRGDVGDIIELYATVNFQPNFAITSIDSFSYLSKLLERVVAGEVIVIARAGKPIAQLTAFAPVQRERVAGQWKEQFHMAEDFDAPLPDDIARAFGAGPSAAGPSDGE